MASLLDYLTPTARVSDGTDDPWTALQKLIAEQGARQAQGLPTAATLATPEHQVTPPPPRAPAPTPAPQAQAAPPGDPMGDFGKTVMAFFGGLSGDGGIKSAMEQSRRNEVENHTLRALMAKGVDAETARAMTKNPQLLQAALPSIFGDKRTKVAPGEVILGPKNQVVYDNSDRQKPTIVPADSTAIRPDGSVLHAGTPKPDKQIVEVFDEATGQPRKMEYDKKTGQMAPVGGVRQEKKAREFTVGDLGKLRNEGGSFQTVKRLSDTFEPRFAGQVGTGDVRNWVGRTLPAGMTTQDAQDGSAWWQDYKRNSELTERHELFGAALTAAEQGQWRQADIHPNMTPEAVQKNLNTRKMLLEGGLRRYANALIQAGYDPAPIASAFGLNLADLGVSKDRQKGSMDQPPTSPKIRTYNPATGRLE